jgi:acyl-CoA thioester hydrolase
MDAYGHVNNVQFLRLLEDARVIAFHGHDSDDGGNVVETGVLVARHEIDYLRPLHYRPEPVSIDLWVSAISGASFDMQYEVLDDEPEKVVYARAESTLVLFDLEAGRPRRFSDAERARMQEWLDTPMTLRRHR